MMNSTVLNEFFTAHPSWSTGLTSLGIHFDSFPGDLGLFGHFVCINSESDPFALLPNEQRFDLSPAFKHLQLEELYLHTPENQRNPSTAPNHLLQSQRGLKRLYIDFHNIFTQNATRENVKAFVGNLETLHLLDDGKLHDSTELPCNDIVTILSFCRKTVKDVSIL